MKYHENNASTFDGETSRQKMAKIILPPKGLYFFISWNTFTIHRTLALFKPRSCRLNVPVIQDIHADHCVFRKILPSLWKVKNEHILRTGLKLKSRYPRSKSKRLIFLLLLFMLRPVHTKKCCSCNCISKLVEKYSFNNVAKTVHLARKDVYDTNANLAHVELREVLKF